MHNTHAQRQHHDLAHAWALPHAPPQAGAGVGHGGVWRYMYMHTPTEGEN